jgi:pimeloyl-ACP methyl ester carboxylesterase
MRSVLLSALGCAIAMSAMAQTERGGARIAKYRSTADGSEQEYAIYVPRGYDPSRKYPLVVGLHEEDSNHIAEIKRIFALPARYGESSLEALMTLRTLPEVDFLVVCPFARGNMGYQGIAEQDVYDAIAEVKRKYAVDEDRVYLTGGSMGGGAALRMALTRPDQWAAVAPVCAAVPPATEELAGNALNLRVRLFHGDQDPAVPVASSRQWQKRFLDLGVPVEYTEYPGVRHNAWDFAYRRSGLFEWFAGQKRNRAPDHVHFSTRWYRYSTAYWVRIDGVTPGVLASVDAVRSGTDVRVMTQNVDAFTITGPARTLNIDGAAMRLRPNAPLSFVKTAGKWSAGSYVPAGKRAGLEGPIVDAMRSRQIWVYGTAGAVTGEELDRRRAVVESGATWWSSRGHLSLAAAIKADRDVTDEEIAGANLILFGTRETNSLIARFAPRFPMRLSAGAADYGMVFVMPVGERYVVVNSGLPWWTGAEEIDRGGYRFVPQPYRLLSTFGDYVVFKGGLGNLLAEGSFDRDWRLPAGAAEKLAATGVVLRD